VVTVSVTPNGYADAVTDGRFVMPEERAMKFGEFLDVLGNPGAHDGVYYVQKQNSNFTSEFRFLHEDAGTEVSWASEAFGKTPDAVNFWMGDERAVTSSKQLSPMDYEHEDKELPPSYEEILR
jgi:jumonji domain-containing protein 7